MRGTTANPAVDTGVRVTLNDPGLEVRSPGEEFAWSVGGLAPGQNLLVPFRAHLPAVFPLFATRPRYAVRHLLKTATVPDRQVSYVHEPTADRIGASGTSYATTPEAAFAACLQKAELTDLSVSVPLPAGLLDETSLLAAFIDYRVLVRLSAVENEALLHGTEDKAIPGLLDLPGSRRRPLDGDMAEVLTSAAAEVEETGGSCDGIVVHPYVYWELAKSGVLHMLAKTGITISRTRMIARDQVLLGDFRAAATLLIPSVASLELLRGTGPEGSDVVRATTRVGLAVHLPQHFLLLSRD